ncbi:hypothetical protein DBV08_18790 [Rhodococcus sp. KBW08]|uniref:hypothetical protein n=1 Tax=Rhodococcus sp. KBW08 TaxID=2144188 RepID=UPI000F5B3AE5|nr:hypothetical protein [Rhodococcus sp. KBW08]RQO45910.1 hypothetical protein DBV08_18790 [Rhodococcus sp. KBW08]
MADVTRFDETWHRLLAWTAGQTPSERLAALVLDEEGYKSIDPAHPLGGRDGGADALLQREGQPWVMAVYFPRGQQTITEIAEKLASDVEKAKKKSSALIGVAFVTNQELRLAERKTLREMGGEVEIDLVHLERMTTILDRPRMAVVREQFLGIAAGPPPILVTAEVLGVARSFDCAEEFLNKIVEVEAARTNERNENLRSALSDPVKFSQNSSLMKALGYAVPDKPAQPLSVDEIASRVEAFRADLKSRWPQCQDYLAGIAWPAMHLKITNLAQSFLTNVQIILTFEGGRGLDFALPEQFEWERLKDPAWEPRQDPFGIAPIRLPDITPVGHPISWDHNDAGDLEVIVDLPELRPHPPWRHKEDEIVLVARSSSDESVTVRYTVTAHGYGTVFEGEPIPIPVERVDMFDSAQVAFQAEKDHRG